MELAEIKFLFSQVNLKVTCKINQKKINKIHYNSLAVFRNSDKKLSSVKRGTIVQKNNTIHTLLVLSKFMPDIRALL